MTFNTCFNRILNYKHRFGQECCWFHSTNVWINGWRWKINVESLCQISASHILTKVYGLLQCTSVKNLTFMWRTISSVKWKRYSMGLIEAYNACKILYVPVLWPHMINLQDGKFKFSCYYCFGVICLNFCTRWYGIP